MQNIVIGWLAGCAFGALAFLACILLMQWREARERNRRAQWERERDRAALAWLKSPAGLFAGFNTVAALGAAHMAARPKPGNGGAHGGPVPYQPKGKR